VQFLIRQVATCPEAAAVPAHASFSLAVSRASVVALAWAGFQQAAECAAAQLAAAEVRLSVAPLADDSPRAGSVDSARDDYLVALPGGDLVPVDWSAGLPADDLAPVDCWAGLPADDWLPVDSADLAPDDCSAVPLADDSAAPDSSYQGAHWVLAGCPDDSPADLQAVDSLAYQVWHSADFRAGQVC
jgi:hypothetical protein